VSHKFRSALAGVLLAASVPAIAQGYANRACDLFFASQQPVYEGGSPRVREHVVHGRRVLLLVPEGYDASSARYPVVFLLHGGAGIPDAWLVLTNLIDFTTALPDDRQAIVVMPDGILSSHWSNWRSGAFHDESLFVDAIIPFIDATYRTIADGRHRAIGGYSAGGVGAMDLPARHPDLFAAAASFSGSVDWPNEPREYVLQRLVSAGVPFCGADVQGLSQPFGEYGNPVLEPVWDHNANPTDLASNFGSTSVTIFSGTGVPCDPDDAARLGPEFPYATFEPFLHVQADSFDAALTKAGVAHLYDDYGCGIHSYKYVERDVHAWWERMFAAFGTAAPTTFDHRRADPSFEVWTWTFTADLDRAGEFLDVVDASSSGVTLTGSGVETVTTAGYFTPGSLVTLTGAVEPSATADASGRITFHVDLGPAHRLEQYTSLPRVAEAGGGYWTNKTVSMTNESE
jgi:S-formylglutathione hydrolase FrmB